MAETLALPEKGETHAAAAYLDTLAAPSTGESLPPVCQNETVNAVALHYLDMAVRSGIADCSIRLEIPEDTGSIPAYVLCIVIGNLLENAVAACAGTDAPFIRMRGRLAEGILTTVMDNRHASISMTPEDSFLSLKPGGGIELLSVRSIAERHGGGYCILIVRVPAAGLSHGCPARFSPGGFPPVAACGIGRRSPCRSVRPSVSP